MRTWGSIAGGGRPVYPDYCIRRAVTRALRDDLLECLHTHGPGWPQSYRGRAALGPPGLAPARTRPTSSACDGVAGAQGWALQHLCMRWISHLYDFWSKSRCKSERAKTVKLQQQILSLSGLKNQSREFGASTATGEHVGNPGEDTARTGEGPLCITRPTSLLTAERHRHSPGYSGPAKTERAERGRELSTLQETRHLKLEFSRRHRLLNNENKHSLQTQEKIQGPCDTNKVWDRIQKSKIHEETGKQNNPKYACA